MPVSCRTFSISKSSKLGKSSLYFSVNDGIPLFKIKRIFLDMLLVGMDRNFENLSCTMTLILYTTVCMIIILSIMYKKHVCCEKQTASCVLKMGSHIWGSEYCVFTIKNVYLGSYNRALSTVYLEFRTLTWVLRIGVINTVYLELRTFT